MTPLLFNLESDAALAARLAQQLVAESGELEQHRFPDGETYLRIHSDCQGRDCLLFCNLNDPDARVLPMLFTAATLRELGARRVLLIAPYLPYMRQDIRFNPGECLTSAVFAKLLSGALDGLITLDPHLHRYASLDEIYRLSSRVVPSAPLIAAWIGQHIDKPLLIGPDSESEQWVGEVARLAGAPSLVLQKQRRGDFDVEIDVPELSQWHGHQPVLIDDIVSSGRTLLKVLEHLRHAGMPRATCIAVHGLFAGDAYARLQREAEIITTNTVPHPSNAICIAGALADACRSWLSA
ncbi:phosphoribosylpyrophosphate synthetase [Marinobacterium nitratireducens]|uniref:Phosphoribosylpyrophosphate synthetase n=1 Tax=Marinobacterium nitratireducens TaxID=518897 RepID=A0A917ZJN3_9GAMM|nr:ribose-phosphate pyrophosphokinase [Marinobacterium nitratireducens]GGO83027.1 phosphoribosylpyrophosphate synthetase [Marinobacterium nitratireducens]